MKKLLLPLIIFAFCLSCGDDDDAVMEPAETVCNVPTALQVSSVGSEDANLNWSDANTSANYSIEYGITGFTLGTGTTLTSTQTNISLTGLAPNTTYQVYVKAICSATNDSMNTNAASFTTLAPRVVAEFLPNLSDLNLFAGNLEDLMPSEYAFEYDLITPLFSDYSSKQRIVALPEGGQMTANGEGMPDFPDNTLIAKTFYYNIDDRDVSLGKTIIETRILLKKNGVWEMGDYIWNDTQTDAVLDNTGGDVAISYIRENGSVRNVNYKIPSATDCIACHEVSSTTTPIGPKLRNLNANNQLQDLIANNYLQSTDVSSITPLPKWDDTSGTYTTEQRARAYMDVNCATCHIDGGSCEFESTLRMPYELDLAVTQIIERKLDIDVRMQSYVPDYSMPQIGTTMIHNEGYNLVRAYLNSL